MTLTGHRNNKTVVLLILAFHSRIIIKVGDVSFMFT